MALSGAAARRRTPLPRGCLFGTFAVMFTVLTCTSMLYVVTDLNCAQAADRWLPDYPGAEVVSQTHSWLRPFGIGETTRILRTPDTVSEVDLWYLRSDRQRTANGELRDSNTAWLRWAVDEVESGGSVIVLVSHCEPALALW